MSEKFLFGVIAILLTSITGLGAVEALQHPEEAAAIVPTAIDTVETAIVNATNTVAGTVSAALSTEAAPTFDDSLARSDSSRGREDGDEDEDEDEDGDDDRGSRSTGGVAPATQSAAAPASKPTTSQGSTGTYTMQQIAGHASASSCFSAIEGSVYDLTSFVSKHPGGSSAIKSLCGVDGTAAFMAQHGGSGSPARTLASFKIGVVAQ